MTTAGSAAELALVAGAVGELVRRTRFPVAFGSGQGVVQHGPGLIAISQTFPALGAIQPGEDRHFQVWYRDAAGPCGSSTNLSNAVRVTFKP